MCFWAVAGALAATPGFYWFTSVLADSGWPGLLRVLAAIPVTVLWVTTIVLFVEACFKPVGWPTPAWLAVFGAAGLLLTIARILPPS